MSSQVYFFPMFNKGDRVRIKDKHMLVDGRIGDIIGFESEYVIVYLDLFSFIHLRHNQIEKIDEEMK